MPCPHALRVAQFPARRWRTRAELARLMHIAREQVLTTDRPITEIADDIGLSACHFSRLFKATYGESARSARAHARFGRVLELIGSGQRVRDAAAAGGYASLTTLHRRLADQKRNSG